MKSHEQPDSNSRAKFLRRKPSKTNELGLRAAMKWLKQFFGGKEQAVAV